MLEDVRVLELEGLGPGPFASMLLADLGADVIVAHRKGGKGLVERQVLDRGKRSIELDLKDQKDVQTLQSLIKSADALIEGFRPGVMERLGLGPEPCMTLNPKLVYGRMTGWGQEGPISQSAGHDLNYIALSGAGYFSGLANDSPFPPPTLVGDIGGGAMYLAVGILAGILKARETGHGTIVDAAIYDGSAHMMNLLMTMRQAGRWPDERGQTMLSGPHWSRCYKTSDGKYMSVQALEPQFYATLRELLGLASDPDLADQHDPDQWEAQSARLAAIFETKTRDEWASLFLGSDACVAPVLSPSEAKAHPQNAARNTWQVFDGVLQAAPAPRFSSEPAPRLRPAPIRGEHTEEILNELNGFH